MPTTLTARQQAYLDQFSDYLFDWAQEAGRQMREKRRAESPDQARRIDAVLARRGDSTAVSDQLRANFQETMAPHIAQLSEAQLTEHETQLAADIANGIPRQPLAVRSTAS